MCRPRERGARPTPIGWFAAFATVALVALNACHYSGRTPSPNPTTTGVHVPEVPSPSSGVQLIAHDIFDSADCTYRRSLLDCANRAARVSGIPVAWSPSPSGFHIEVMSALWPTFQKGVAQEQWHRGGTALMIHSSGTPASTPGRVVQQFTWNGSSVGVRLTTTPQDGYAWQVSATWSYREQRYAVRAFQLTTWPAAFGALGRWQDGLAVVIHLFHTMRYANPPG
jgi:hypothetical protein